MLPYTMIYPYSCLAILQIVYLFAVTPLRYSLTRSILSMLFIFIPMIFSVFISLRWFFGAAHKNLLYTTTVEIPLILVFAILSKRKFVSQTTATLSVLTISSVIPIVENLFYQILYWEIAWIRALVYPIIVPALFLFFAKMYKPLHEEIESAYKKGFFHISSVLLLSYGTLWVTFTFAEESLISIVIFLLPAILVLVLLILLFAGLSFFLQKYKQSLLRLHDAAVTESQFEPLSWQIQLLQKGQEQLAIARHDMRHTLTSINALLSEGNTDKIQEYVNSLLKNIGSFAKTAEFSKNILINSIMLNYTSIMTREDIKYDVNIYSIPVKVPIDEMELTVFLCNALENAIKATKVLPPEERYVSIKSSYNDETLLLTIENTFDHLKPVIVEELDPLSISGIGLYSMQNFANKYGVILDMKTSENIFSLRAYFSKDETAQTEESKIPLEISQPKTEHAKPTVENIKAEIKNNESQVESYNTLRNNNESQVESYNTFQIKEITKETKTSIVKSGNDTIQNQEINPSVEITIDKNKNFTKEVETSTLKSENDTVQNQETNQSVEITIDKNKNFTKEVETNLENHKAIKAEMDRKAQKADEIKTEMVDEIIEKTNQDNEKELPVLKKTKNTTAKRDSTTTKTKKPKTSKENSIDKTNTQIGNNATVKTNIIAKTNEPKNQKENLATKTSKENPADESQ